MTHARTHARTHTQLKDSIKALLREVQFAPEEYLCEINTMAHEMFFIVTGKVCVACPRGAV